MDENNNVNNHLNDNLNSNNNYNGNTEYTESNASFSNNTFFSQSPYAGTSSNSSGSSYGVNSKYAGNGLYSSSSDTNSLTMENSLSPNNGSVAGFVLPEFENVSPTYGNSGLNIQSAETDDNNEKGSKKKKEKKAKKVKEAKENKGEKKPGIMKKLLLCVFLGIIFGVCAAFSMYFINKYVVKDKHINVADNQNSPVDSQTVSDNNEKKPNSTIVSSNGDSNSGINRDNPNGKVTKIAQNNVNGTGVMDVTGVVEATMPSLVAINNEYTVDSYMYYYGSWDSTVEASGSGIILGTNGNDLLIVTNYHVIENNDKLTVVFCDDEEVTATVKGTDSSMDLAVITVNLNDMKDSTKSEIAYAMIGESDSLKVGQPVIAIGNSLGYGQAVTTGVVSALNRKMIAGNAKRKFIQTDAAINHGNSGGALLNINGEVIGINSNKIDATGAEGMGYAIPISDAWPIIEELATSEPLKPLPKDKQAYLGVDGSDVSVQEMTAYGYPSSIYIAYVDSSSPADKVGIKKGDFFAKFDGRTVSSVDELAKLLECYEKDTEVEVVIYRLENDVYEEKTIKVKLGHKK